MIRDRETLNILLDNIARFVRERLIPNEEVVAETDEIPDGHRGKNITKLAADLSTDPWAGLILSSE